MTDPRPETPGSGAIREMEVAALDFVVSRQGVPYFLEANDRPMGMGLCDEFLAGAGAAAAHMPADCRPVAGRCLKSLADLLAGLGDEVVLACVEALPPDLDRGVPLPDGVPEWLDWEWRETLRLRDLLARCGRRVTLWFPAAGRPLPPAAGCAQVIYRRCFRLPDAGTADAAVINSAAAYRVTGGKLATHAAVASRAAHVRQPRSLPAGDAPTSILAGVEEMFRRNVPACVVKPDWGSLGLGLDVVHSPREAAAILEGRLRARGSDWPSRFGPFLVQELINGDRYLAANGQEYLYDVRVYVVAGAVAGAVARRSAVPARFGRESSAAHIGAGGGLVPLIVGPGDKVTTVHRVWSQEAPDLPPPLILPASVWETIEGAAADVCRAVAEAASAGEYAKLPGRLTEPPGYDWYLEFYNSVTRRG